MKPVIRIVPKALSIDFDLLSVKEMYDLLTYYEGYTDGDSRQVIIWRKK